MFSLPLMEFTAPCIMDILSMPVVARQIGIDSEELSRLMEWVKDSGIRRGVGPGSRNTWCFGLDRLFLSSCMAMEEMEGVDSYNSVLPMDFPVEGALTELLARLSGFVFDMESLVRRLIRQESRSPAEWSEIFQEMAAYYIYDDPHARRLMEKLKQVTDVMREAGVESVNHEVMHAFLSEELEQPLPPHSFITGKVLFSSLVPMRTIPFRLICLLGMDIQ
jgi:exodeoxyribonuclease V gamma subunit